MTIQRLRSTIQRVADRPKVRFALSIYSNYNSRNGPLLAAGLAFFLLLSLVPLLLVGLACLGFYMHATGSTTNASGAIQSWLNGHVLPGVSNGVAKDLMDRVDLPDKMTKISNYRSVSGIIGLIGLLSASMQIFVTGSVAMNAAWGVKESRSWVSLRLISVALLLGTGILVALSIAATTAGTMLTKFIPSMAIYAGSELAAVLAAFLMYALVYLVLPAVPVSVRSAAFGALVASILWEVAKKGLAVYLVRPNPSTYGSLADVFALLLWLYYSMMILLIGAEASAAYSARYEKGVASLDVARQPAKTSLDRRQSRQAGTHRP